MRKTNLAICALLLGTVALQAQNWPSGHAYRRAIAFDPAKVVGGDQAGFPVLISGTFPYLAGVSSGGGVQSPLGYDIMFASDDSGNNRLEFERVSYVAATGAVKFWVKVPTLRGDTAIYLFYGKSSATDQSNPSAVWDAGYKGVWHLDGSPLSVADSTSAANHGAATAATATAGQIAGAANFSGASQFIDVGNNSSLQVTGNLTIEAWVKPTDYAWYRGLLGKTGGLAGNVPAPYDYYLAATSGLPVFLSGNGTVAAGSVGTAAPATGQWSHVAVTMSGATVSHYLNGVPNGANTISATIADGSTNAKIGSREDSVTMFKGAMDEVRISNTPRTAGWIATEYNNQSSPSSFYAIGAASTLFAAGLTTLSNLGYREKFLATYDDAKGVQDIQEVQLVVNSYLSTLLACYARYVPGQGYYLRDDYSTVWLGPVAAGSTVQNGQCLLDADAPPPVASGNRLTVQFNMRFRAGFVGVKQTYLWAWGSNSTNSGWQPQTAYNVTAALPPTSTSADQSGSGTSHTFTFKAHSDNGSAFINRVIVLLNWAEWLSGGCSITYEGGAFTLAENTESVPNPRCTLKSASAQPAADDDLVLTIELEFKPAFKGRQMVFQHATDANGLSSNWIQVGTWTAYAALADPPQTQPLQPATGSGTAVTFQFKATDVNGASYMPTQNLALGTLADPGCTLVIYHAENLTYLVNDIHPGTPVPSGGSATNGLCTVSGISSLDSGNDWLYGITAIFQSPYAGLDKPIYQNVSDRAQLTTGWQPQGVWTVPSSGSLPLLSAAMSHTGNFSAGQSNATYNVTVSNSPSAGPSGGVVTITETVPSGLTITSMSGAGWTCAAAACTRADALAPGASYPPVSVNVNVASNAPSPRVNSVTVSGGGSVSASTTDSTVIVPAAPVLSVTQTAIGNFIQSASGTYTVNVANSGALPTSGTVTVTETLPAGLTMLSMAGSGWNCGGSLCTRSDTLASGASYPLITVSVSVAQNATSPQINTVAVSGGGSASWETTYTTAIQLGPRLTISLSHTGNFTQGQQGATYSIQLVNAASAGPTYGTVTVTEVVPPGLTLTGMAGAGWTCAGNTCTRGDVLPAGSSFPLITATMNVTAAPGTVTNVATASGGGSPNATGSDLTNIAPTQTITTSPAGLSLTVDGVVCTSPCIFPSWAVGSNHTIAASGPQSAGSGTQYVNPIWSDLGTASHIISTPSLDFTFTATFTKQYYLTTSTATGGGGSTIPPSGWYDSGATVAVGVTVNDLYSFGGVSGALTGSTLPQSLTMTGPASVTATFRPDFTIATPTGMAVGDAAYTVDGFLHSAPIPITLNLTGPAASPATVTLSAPDMPTGFAARFDPESISLAGSGSTTMWVTPPVASGGHFTVRARASNAFTVHTTDINLTVQDFTITPAVLYQSAGPNETVQFAFAVAPQGGFNAAVTIVGVRMTPTSGGTCGTTGWSQQATAGTVTLTLPLIQCTTVHSYDIAVTFRGGNILHDSIVTVGVCSSSPLSLIATPAVLQVQPGESATFTISSTNGFAGSVAFNTSTLPTCTSPTFHVITVPGSGILELGTANCSPGTYAVNIVGTSGSASASVPVTLVVKGPESPANIISPSPTSTLSGDSATFTWNSGSQVTQYQLDLTATDDGTVCSPRFTGSTRTSASMSLAPCCRTRQRLLSATLTSTFASGGVSSSSYAYACGEQASSYSITGRITSGEVGLAGVSVSLEGSELQNTTTSADGSYAFTAAAGASYKITPTLSTYYFGPASVSIPSLTQDRTVSFRAVSCGVITSSQGGKGGFGDRPYAVGIPVIFSLPIYGASSVSFVPAQAELQNPSWPPSIQVSRSGDTWSATVNTANMTPGAYSLTPVVNFNSETLATCTNSIGFFTLSAGTPQGPPPPTNCASMTGTWLDVVQPSLEVGAWELNDASGSPSGRLRHSPGCGGLTWEWEVFQFTYNPQSKKYLLAAHNPTPNTPCGGKVPVSIVITDGLLAGGPYCGKGAGKFTSDTVQEVADTITVSERLPNHETGTFAGFGLRDGYDTLATFNPTTLFPSDTGPSDGRFAGRDVKEFIPTADDQLPAEFTGADTCWWPGAPWLQNEFTRLATQSRWFVQKSQDGSSVYGPDFIGFAPNVVAYMQQFSPNLQGPGSSCQIRYPQLMKIGVEATGPPQTWEAYGQAGTGRNMLIFTFTKTTVSVKRGGVDSQPKNFHL